MFLSLQGRCCRLVSVPARTVLQAWFCLCKDGAAGLVLSLQGRCCRLGSVSARTVLQAWFRLSKDGAVRCGRPSTELHGRRCTTRVKLAARDVLCCSCCCRSISRRRSDVSAAKMRLTLNAHVFRRVSASVLQHQHKGGGQVMRGRFLTSASKFNIEPNGVIFDVT